VARVMESYSRQRRRHDCIIEPGRNGLRVIWIADAVSENETAFAVCRTGSELLLRLGDPMFPEKAAACVVKGGPVGNRRRGGASNGREGASWRRTIPTTPTSLRRLRGSHAADQEIRQRRTERRRTAAEVGIDEVLFSCSHHLSATRTSQ
jgi:hypothetical protein